MKIITIYFLALTVSLSGILRLGAQSGPDDYWLNNGFTDGQTIIINSGSFYDDGGSGLYNTGNRYSVRFCSENGNPLTMDFREFATYYNGVIPPDSGSYTGYDYLFINVPGLDSFIAYWDDTPEFSFTSESGCMDFRFVSEDSSEQRNGWVADISANPPPPNNDPCDAINLPVGNVSSPSFYTNKGAYNTTNLKAACLPYFGGDVWFSALVPSSGELKIEVYNGTLTYPVVAAYGASDCNNLSLLSGGCTSGTGPVTTLFLDTEVSAGEVVYIRVYGEQAKSGTFGIAAVNPKAEIVGFTGPGGVGDSISNKLWLRADLGVLTSAGIPANQNDAVETWEDQSGSLNDMTQLTGAGQPSFESTSLNGKPALSFDGTTDYFNKDLSSSFTATAPLHFFTVTSFASSAEQTVLSLGDVDNSNTLSISKDTDGSYYSFSQGSKKTGPVVNSAGEILSVFYDNTGTLHRVYQNGAEQVSDDLLSPVITNGVLNLGRSNDGNLYLDGDLSEVILYRKKLNEAQRIIVNNYLAAKYNFNIGGIDYFEYESGFSNDVAGIGRAGDNSLHSKSQSAGILSLGGASSLDNNDFVFFGHDKGDFTSWESVTEIPSNDPDIRRLMREWRVDITGDPGTLSIGISNKFLPDLPAGFDAYAVFIDDDGDFSSGAVDYGLNFSGDEYIVNNVTLSKGQFIMVAAVNVSVQFSKAADSARENVANPQIQVELNYPLNEFFDVGYRVIDGTATNGGIDFSLNPGRLEFTPGEKSKFIQPLVIDDTLVEIPDEYFVIEIHDPSGNVTLGDTTTFRYTILDNDLSLELLASDTLISKCTGSLRDTTTLTAVALGQTPIQYLWTPGGQTTPSIEVSPDVNTVYSVKVNDVLGNEKELAIEIEVKSPPVKPSISFAGTGILCEGDSLQLTSDSAAAYLWSTGETTRSIYVSTNEAFTVSVFDEFNCRSEDSDPVNPTIIPTPGRPVITLSGDPEFCEGDSVILTSTDASGGSYFWNNGDTSSSITVKQSGTYFLSIENASGCSSQNSDTVEVTVNPIPSQPSIDIQGSITFCEGDSVILSSPVQADAYIWSNGESTESIVVKQTADISLVVVTNSCESIPSDTVNVTVEPSPAKPVIIPQGATRFCEGGSVILGAGTADTYLWSNGATMETITVSSSGKYSVRVTDGNNCFSPPADSVEVIVDPLPGKPVVLSDKTGPFCEGDTVRVGSSISADTYLWSTGAVDSAITVTTSGTFSLTVFSEEGCESELSDDFEINFNPVPGQPVISPSGDTEFCEGGTVQLESSPGDAFLWSNGETTSAITVNETGVFTVSVLSAAGCESEASLPISVTVNPVPEKPVITPSGTLTIYIGETVTLTSSEGDNYLWSNGESTQSIVTGTEGKYSVRIISDESCESPVSDTVTVLVENKLPQPDIIAEGPLEFCVGGSVVLTSEEAAAYLWSTGETTQSITVSESAIITLVVENASGIQSEVSEPVEVLVNPLPVIDLLATPVSCYGSADGESTVMISGGTPTYAISWSNGADSESVNNLTAGTYSVTVTDSKSCQVQGEVEITEPEELRVSAVLDPSYCEETDDGRITLTINGGTQPYSAEWNDGRFGMVLSDLFPGTYGVTIMDGNDCEITREYILGFENDICFRIPDIFTPNNDGTNDYWEIPGLEQYPQASVEIYDRWGKRVFYLRPYDDPWNGTFNGKDLPMESYHYIIDLNNGSEPIIGNITIVR